MLLLRYERGLRVLVHTANALCCTVQAQGAFVQDFPPKHEHSVCDVSPPRQHAERNSQWAVTLCAPILRWCLRATPAQAAPNALPPTHPSTPYPPTRPAPRPWRSR